MRIPAELVAPAIASNLYVAACSRITGKFVGPIAGTPRLWPFMYLYTYWIMDRYHPGKSPKPLCRDYRIRSLKELTRYIQRRKNLVR